MSVVKDSFYEVAWIEAAVLDDLDQHEGDAAWRAYTTRPDAPAKYKDMPKPPDVSIPRLRQCPAMTPERRWISLEGALGVTLQGGGIFTPGFPLTLAGSSVKHNTPDDCFGC